ncbi:cytoplasmic protein [Neobacillus sp. YIM B02564]|uniref:Cytoplasmic protein n=1 Tax=Neobacillus paridis TaxID=2803862 RepID=A0ABS1TQY0_9BACI|nr:cytoplasmic protein [Neobacillus paridis]MBL4953464.1 cytoplasmic protein [Neobacillus paridis]
MKKLEISGHAAIGGRVKAEEVRVKGILKVAKDCETEIFKAESQFIIGGLLNAEHIEIQIYGECTAKEIGYQTIKVKYESFHSSGGFEIKGLLTAETINIALRFGSSNAEEIGGGKITVKRKKNSLFPFGKETGSLQTKVIEGDDIYLENTTADIVRGNKIKIGPGCIIGTVEYRTDFQQDPDSTVKTVSGTK